VKPVSKDLLVGAFSQNLFAAHVGISQIHPVITYQLGHGWALSAGDAQFTYDWEREAPCALSRRTLGRKRRWMLFCAIKSRSIKRAIRRNGSGLLCITAHWTVRTTMRRYTRLSNGRCSSTRRKEPPKQ
jgi:hypothetical protein